MENEKKWCPKLTESSTETVFVTKGYCLQRKCKRWDVRLGYCRERSTHKAPV